jgi:hypothetical protein
MMTPEHWQHVQDLFYQALDSEERTTLQQDGAGR